MTRAFDAWDEAYRRLSGEGQELMWPSETLVRLLKGSYVPGARAPWRGARVLDVGAGNGNNLLLCASLGLDCHGTEVTQALCDSTRARLASRGCVVDMRVGTNRSLPFDDAHFDLLVSWNVLHYEQSEGAIRAALAEYRRVLRPGGRLYLSTTGPEHKLLVGAELVGPHLRRIRRSDDFRAGEVMFTFDTTEYLVRSLEEQLDDVRVGRTHDHLFTETLDWFVATGVRHPAEVELTRGGG